MRPEKLSIPGKLAVFHEHWSPKIVAQVNDTQVKLAKLQGAFEFHRHDDADEAFYVLRGSLRIEFRDGTVELEAGDLIVVPRGVEHRPVAEMEAHVMLIEPEGTVSTGDHGAGGTTGEWI